MTVTVSGVLYGDPPNLRVGALWSWFQAEGNYVSAWSAEIDLGDIELPDDDITPDEAEPLPDEELVKTDPVPEEVSQ